MADRPGSRRRAPAGGTDKSHGRGRRKAVIDVGDGVDPAAAGDAEPAADEPEDDGDGDGDELDDGLVLDGGAVIDVGDDEAGDGDHGDGEDAERDPDTHPPMRTRRARARRTTSDPGGARPERSGLVRRDPLQVYMSEVRRFDLLSPEDEHDLAVRLTEAGDSDAARRLIEANLRLVVKIAYEYRRAHKNLLDLIQEGNVGLMQAVRKFDPYRGVKLSSYAAFWIRAYMLKFILNNWRMVKIGTTQAQRKLFFNLRKERERLEQLGFEPTTALLAENLQVSEKDVVEMDRRLAAPEASLDAPLPGDEDGARTRLDFLPSDSARPDQAVAASEFSALLRDKLETFAAQLEGREQTIFRERWLTDEPLTLQQIGDQYGVSRERARQLEKRVLGRLRKYLEAELGTAVDIDSLSRD